MLRGERAKLRPSLTLNKFLGCFALELEAQDLRDPELDDSIFYHKDSTRATLVGIYYVRESEGHVCVCLLQERA